MQQKKIIPIYLSDVYASIDSSPIYELESGVSEENPMFMKGDQVCNYISSNKSATKNQVITFVIEGLINVYWGNKERLTEEMCDLERATNHPQPTFNYVPSVNLYEMEGTITPYSMVYINVSDFLNFTAKNEPISVELSGIDTIIEME